MRRFVVALFALCWSVALLAAAPPSSILGTPVLVVYPFSVNGSSVDREAGSRLAVAIATQISDLGGVEVKPATPGVERQEYLAAAHREGADYYIAGYVTPLGDGVSVVEQLVSTQTGIVVYSNTAQVRTYADAAGQGDILRDALLRHQTRNLGAYAAPPPPAATPAATPAPGSAAQANLGRLFGRRQKTAAPAKANPNPTPTAAAALAAAPSPSPSATAASVALGHESKYGILAIGGSADGDRRSFTNATREAACNEAGVGTLLGGNLSTHNHTILGQPQTIATFELLAYDCAGNVVYRQTFADDARGDWKSAVNAVVASAVATFLRTPPATAPHS